MLMYDVRERALTMTKVLLRYVLRLETRVETAALLAPASDVAALTAVERDADAWPTWVDVSARKALTVLVRAKAMDERALVMSDVVSVRRRARRVATSETA